MARRSTAKRPRSKAERSAETQEQIIDAAEYLFSKRGFEGVTLRDVADRVGVHNSLMYYYFDDKMSLFKAVFERRSGETIRRRMEAMDRYEQESGGKPTVEGALHAFLDTDFDLYIEGGEPWKNYAAFGSQISNTPEGSVMMDFYFDPVVLRLIDLLKKAMPEMPDEDVFWGYIFVSGALLHILGRTGRIDRLSSGLCHSDDFPAAKKRMAKFMAAGFLALKD